MIKVLVVGAGMAGLSAALTARQEGADVTVLECAPPEERGGNTRFSNSAMRFVSTGAEDVYRLVPDLTAAERARGLFSSYSRAQYFEDIARLTQHRCDPDLVDALVDDSYQTLLWLKEQGVRFLPMWEWALKLPDGRVDFGGGGGLEAWGAGAGISDALFAQAERRGVTVHYDTRAEALVDTEAGIRGVLARQGRRHIEFGADRVVLAAGGFQANPEWRVRYLGPGWDLAKVRGSRFDNGDGLRMALSVGAQSYGNWSGCHSASWDLNAPDVNELEFGTVWKRDDFLYGIMVNARGERFVDEGEDVRSHIYAKMGREILAQPRQFAWQVYDAKVAALIHAEYRTRRSCRIVAPSLETLAAKMEGVNREGFLATVAEFNRAVRNDIPFDPGRKDGRRTVGLAIDKTNWAQTIDTPPFEAYGVTCGVTFTFGGVRTDAAGRVLDAARRHIPGLYAAGEMMGGLFYFNYAGGAGLSSAAVFGRRAGKSAAMT